MNSKKSPSSKTAAKLLVLVIAAALISAILHVSLNAKYNDWVSATAEITDLKKTPGSRRRRSRWKVTFAYSANDKYMTGTDSFNGSIPDDIFIGGEHTVWYDPASPADVRFSTLRPTGNLESFIPFFFAIPIALYIVGGGTKGRKNSSM